MTVRQTKFFKTRILPVPDGVMIELRAFARSRADASQGPCSGLFWHEQGRTRRYTPEAITWLFLAVIRRAGLKSQHGRTGPRLHDLRHSMVVNRILEWYPGGHQFAGSSTVPRDLPREQRDGLAQLVHHDQAAIDIGQPFTPPFGDDK
ncbi:hypothetical protein NKJ01_35610 [Mesorhizobium sp. M0276]